MSNNGNLLNRLLQETNTCPTSIMKDKGSWTRVNRNTPSQCSIIDYVITENNDQIIDKLEIDEDGLIRPHHTKTKNGTTVITETDHNSIQMTISTGTITKPTKATCWKKADQQTWNDFNENLLK